MKTDTVPFTTKKDEGTAGPFYASDNTDFKIPFDIWCWERIHSGEISTIYGHEFELHLKELIHEWEGK